MWRSLTACEQLMLIAKGKEDEEGRGGGIEELKKPNRI